MKRVSADQFSALGPGQSATQCAALCWRLQRGRVQVLLITSRETKRWIVPKGWPMPDKSPEEAAAIEAWEEAGVKGDLAGAAPLGQYFYEKLRTAKKAVPCIVSVFGLRVTKLADRYPERQERRRKWFDAKKAARKVAEPELRALLVSLVSDGRTLRLQDKAKKPA